MKITSNKSADHAEDIKKAGKGSPIKSIKSAKKKGYIK